MGPTANRGDNTRSHRLSPPPDTDLNRLADELRINMATRLFTSQEREANTLRGVTEHGAVNATMRDTVPSA